MKSQLYDSIPEGRLLAIQGIKLDDLTLKEDKYRLMWKNNKLCSCVNIFSETALPACEHVKKSLKNHFIEERKKLSEISDIIAIKLLYKSFENRFDTL